MSGSYEIYYAGDLFLSLRSLLLLNHEICFSLKMDFCFFFMGTMLRSRQRDSFVLIVSMEGDLDTSLCFLSQKDDECYSSKVF